MFCQTCGNELKDVNGYFGCPICPANRDLMVIKRVRSRLESLLLFIEQTETEIIDAMKAKEIKDLQSKT